MDKTICILLPVITDINGGAELFAVSLQKDLAERGYASEIIYHPFHAKTKKDLIKTIVSFQALDFSRYYGIINTKFPSYLIDHPNQYLYLIHQHRELYEFFGTRFSSFRHNSYDDCIRELIYKLEKKALKEINTIKCISKNVKNRLKRYFDLDTDYIYIPPPFKELYTCCRYENYILFISRFEEDKRPHLFIDAFLDLPKSINGIMIGKGRLKPLLYRMIEKRGLSDRIQIKSELSINELVNLYKDSLCVVFCPFDEDYGFITLEAFLSKKPVITLEDSGGVLEFVEDEINGFICSESSEDIAERVRRLIDNKTKARNLGNNGFEKVKKISYNNLIEDISLMLGL